MMLAATELAKQVVRVRMVQLMVNEDYRKGTFEVPIHLALGHEAIAVALASVLREGDSLLLSHRNIAYNLARADSAREVYDEYLLKKQGLGGGKSGSMNLVNPARGVLYSSSILGNNFPVGAGVALAKLLRGSTNVACVLGGDGSIEEGAFYEMLIIARSLDLPLLVVIENNEWSMSTHVRERRAPISLASLARAVGIPYKHLSGNNVVAYARVLGTMREKVRRSGPALLEVSVSTLGDWVKEEGGKKRFINYHSGPAPTISWDAGSALIKKDRSDPLYVLERTVGKKRLSRMMAEVAESLSKELS